MVLVKNDNEAFKALTVQFVQKEFDYDYSINYYCIN